jgi:hypothetical protein
MGIVDGMMWWVAFVGARFEEVLRDGVRLKMVRDTGLWSGVCVRFLLKVL